MARVVASQHLAISPATQRLDKGESCAKNTENGYEYFNLGIRLNRFRNLPGIKGETWKN